MLPARRALKVEGPVVHEFLAEGSRGQTGEINQCNKLRWVSMKKAKPHIVVVGAVLVRDGRILAARRSDEMSLPGYWEFPGGKIEPGETPEEALRRELEEELLCTAEIGDHLETTTHEYDFGIVTLSTYLCTLLSGEPQVTEHAELRWLMPDELGSVEWAPADIPAIERLKSMDF